MKFLLVALSSMLLSMSLDAATPKTKPDPRVELAKRIPGSSPEQFQPSPIAGVFEFTQGAHIAYVTSDGKYVIDGDLFELASETNVSEQRRRDARRKLIAGVPDRDTVVFGGAGVRHTVSVFTDIDCGFCREMHSQIAKYNELGIRVRYLFYPRSGPDTDSWDKAVTVWCSKNRNDALTRAKRGEDLKSVKCGSNPVARDYELGQQLGLRGTPAIVLPSGELLPGFLPPAMLAQRLENGSKRDN